MYTTECMRVCVCLRQIILRDAEQTRLTEGRYSLKRNIYELGFM